MDAIRGGAMVLVVTIHASLSLYIGMPWVFSDSTQNVTTTLLINFMMATSVPVFFMISGYFTEQTLQRYGVKGMLRRRFRSVLRPFLIAAVTVLPIAFVSIWLLSQETDSSAERPSRGFASVWDAVQNGTLVDVREQLASNAADRRANPYLGYGSSSLHLAAYLGRLDMLALLLRHGGEIEALDLNGNRPLHAAALFGRAEVFKTLHREGALLDAHNREGKTPLDMLAVDWHLTRTMAYWLDIELTESEVWAGRAEIRASLGLPPHQPFSVWSRLVHFLDSLPGLLHLWFLWTLWSLTVLYAGYAALANRLPWLRPSQRIVLSPLGIGVWALVAFFGVEMTESFYISFTPKVETTILNRWPALLLYGSFFFWGAWYFDCQREEERFGRYWRLALPVVLVVIFPVGIELVYGFWGFRDLFGAQEAQVFFANVLVVLFVWLALYSIIGLARDHLSRPNRALSLLYAGSFWVYLVHMPVAIVAQWAFLHVPIPGLVKLVLTSIITLAVPLLPYLYIIRGTWLDHFIHGRQLQEPQMGRAN
ncbi:MAG: acyltransferase family protein [Gemmatimonadota bacterium]|nr:acyltransferase family protein [Gemmatimonadota bacterium]